MTGRQPIPRDVRWTVRLALLGLALAVPFSAPDGTGMQWDELVLGAVAASSAVSMYRLVRRMDATAARPWRVVGVAAPMFMTAQWLQAAFPGPAFDGFGFDEVLLFGGALAPLVTCGMLARQVTRTRWTALVVDGAVITAALLVVTEVLRTPLGTPADAPDDLRSLVLAYGGYAAVMLGCASALCTVSTRSLRRSVTVMLGAVACQVSAACFEALAIIAPSPLWVAGSDLSVAFGLMSVVVAAHHAPRANADRGARAASPRVSPLGMVMVVACMLGLPVAITLSLCQGRPLPIGAEIGCAVVFSLMALRLVLRIREDGKLTEDLVRSEEDFQDLVESSNDGITIVDADLQVMFASPAARSLLGIVPDADRAVSLLDLVEGDDRALVRSAIEGCTPVLQFRVRLEDGTSRELEATSSSSGRPGSGRRVLYLRDVTTRRRRERELERMAYTDHLTRLPNRAMLFEEMAAESAEQRCLLVLDLDGFKGVNDVAGHEAGDQLLVEVARRLHTVIREDDLVARLGGDEFAVLVTGSLADARDVAQRIVDVMAVPHRVGEWAFAVGASVGVAELTAAGGQTAFREADAALRSAKEAGKGCVHLADSGPSALAVGIDLPSAFTEGSLALRLDAACDADGRIDLVHALPVWDHPGHGTVRPAELWRAAERLGRAADLQRWLIRQACAEIAAMPDDRVGIVVSLPAGHV
ncbi:MAG TPA: diguanylate cyclase, partial [Blastococcus sp.]